jgi:ATP synthase protein I
MSQNSSSQLGHPSGVQADASSTTKPTTDGSALRPAIDPAARSSKRMYQGLSSSSVGLELGIAVILGLLFGMWLDRRLGTEPWMMLLFLVFGLVAGFRNVLRAVARAEKDGL